jgi:peptidoglycan glycosyltransferase
MNAPIRRVFAFLLLLFGVLVVGTTWNTVIDAQGLRDNPLNRRELLEDQMIQRGTIYANDGSTVLAVSHKAAGGLYVRSYPQAGLFAHAIGYSYIDIGQSGLERSDNDALTGQTESVSTILDQLQGRQRVGDDVVTTLDPAAQRIALHDLGSNRGSVVALNPSTGGVLVFASTPGFDPNGLSSQRFSQLNLEAGAAPLLDRSTQSAYPPGSTFKVVTAAAALDSGRYTPSSTVNGNSPQVFSGTPLQNDGNQSWGQVDLSTALTNSVNTAWANVAVSLGRSTMERYMKRFGFYSTPPIDLPSSEVVASGERLNGRLIPPTSSYVDLGRMGIGQDKLAVTPLQMAMVAAAVANGGRLMRPHITDRIVDRDGRVVSQIQPQLQSTVMSHQAAGELTQMMTNVVEEGTGQPVAIPGLSIAGKTGTAEVGNGDNQVWFIAFAPVSQPRVAIAVTMESQPSGSFGGPVAGPIVRDVLMSLLNQSGGGGG